MSARRWVHSLRFRLLVATLAALLVALLLAGLLLASLFRDHVLRQFTSTLTAQLDQVTARLEFNPGGQPQLDAQTLSDPRWSRPYSGLYWQIDAVIDKDANAQAGGPTRRGVLRSRSLWDATLTVPNDALANGSVHVHETTGPDGAPLLLVERSVRPDAAGAAGTPWRLLVAADLSETEAAVDRFNGVLLASLAVLMGLLCAAAVAQVAVGLSPLRALQRALVAVREGRAPRLEGRFPAEVQALTDDFNSVLDRNAEVVARARTQAGNLAHAIKTPLAAMAQAAQSAAQRPDAAAELPALVQEQVAVSRRHVDWHLARSRAAAALGVPGARVAVAPVVDGLLRVLERVHAERGLTLGCAGVASGASFAGEAQDLQEILGNLLDNACKWARHEVRVSAARFTEAGGQRLRIVVEDDGPGIAPAQRQAAMARGERLDESVPGSGLGLAIVHELVHLYGGRLSLGQSALGGLRAELTLPGAAGLAGG